MEGRHKISSLNGPVFQSLEKGGATIHIWLSSFRHVLQEAAATPSAASPGSASAVRAGERAHFSEYCLELFSSREALDRKYSSITTKSPLVTPVEDRPKSPKMAPANLPSVFNATSQDIEMLLAAQAHLGSKNLQTHMEPYLWKTRADGVNVINVGKTW